MALLLYVGVTEKENTSCSVVGVKYEYDGKILIKLHVCNVSCNDMGPMCLTVIKHHMHCTDALYDG